ncbi:MAG: cell division protein FtsL [Gammaproteobacteria bacterium]|nr:MAG: cell division protein FtsL [Gammaproteobacteria bacterium]
MKIINFILLTLVLWTSFNIVNNSHVFHATNTNIQKKIVEKRALQEIWGQLLLEKSTLESPHRAHNIAIKNLNMHYIQK